MCSSQFYANHHLAQRMRSKYNLKKNCGKEKMQKILYAKMSQPSHFMQYLTRMSIGHLEVATIVYLQT